jgi:Kae1-associated kinase Bud32
MYKIKSNLAEGAEAKIYLIEQDSKQFILKERIPKTYRAKELDIEILKKRVKSEFNILQKANKIINVPKVYSIEDYKIIMDYLDLPEAKFILKKDLSILKIIAKYVSKMHSHNIIHGDLTLCNILYDVNEKKPYFIDFGLSYISNKLEDKAMDLEVFREILIADFSEKHWLEFIDAYENKDILKQLEKIQKRKKYLG